MELHSQYLAGLFDGEGWVSVRYVARRRQKTDPTKVIRSMRFVLGITMTFRDVLVQIHAQCGGHIYQPKSKPGHKPIWSWRLTGRDEQVRFLIVICDHLIVKREIAELSIRFLQTVAGFGHRLTQDQWEERLKIYERISVLNRRGTRQSRIPEPPPLVPKHFELSQIYSPDEIKEKMQEVRSHLVHHRSSNPSPAALRSRRYRERKRLRA